MPKETFHLHSVENPDTKPIEDLANLESINELKAKRQAKIDASLYDEKGQVNDPEIAREMAKVEDPYRTSFFRSTKKGIKAAEIIGEKLQTEKETKRNRSEILNKLNKHLIEGMEKNEILQNILVKYKKKIQDMLFLGDNYISISPIYDLRRNSEKKEAVMYISFNDNGFIEILYIKPDMKVGEKKYRDNKEDLQELEEDIAEWAQNSTVWGERKGLI